MTVTVFSETTKTRRKDTGSFDIVIKNMERFVELYPDYPGRGLVVTLTATSDFDEIERFVSQWQRFFPTIIGSFVQTVPPDSIQHCSNMSSEIGDLRTLPCEDRFCGNERPLELDQTDVCRGSMHLSQDHHQPGEVPEFCNWTKESNDRLQSSHDRFMAEVCLLQDPSAVNVVRSSYPLGSFLCDRGLRTIHFRRLSANRNSGRYAFRMSCYPGATRTFCSVQGALFSCEKTERGRLFELGSATNDLDVNRACELTEMVRLLCDCGNCSAKRFCSHCSALVSESRENSKVADARAFQRQCRQMAQVGVPRRLTEYAEIMELNPGMLDALLSATTMDDDWLNDVKIVVPKRKEADVAVEEIAEFV